MIWSHATLDRAVGRVDPFTGQFAAVKGAPMLTQAAPWGHDSGASYGSGGDSFDGDGAGPNTPAEQNHPYEARQRNFGSLAHFH
mmetsp:Transcript_27352/g.63538  ORF Transcript_27352/g.63538 Transcript_27352/m.63538 type:complete len:84 (-) Transcript_27352:306-557(-)|eukprot:CAMPEP_0114126192 /NCGR_PEP_ID=MMETSP0043_2-20121206/9699_1 /TAXON_ID=464988 /ORGANISM="Hemiselmis andersenii, Strain CCMP644" /LENGTH=83 /DNA_ID=CAMNT_0001219161 /DNA_START=17 /DNA_END=268 /DNA_ORIENTATION=-